MPSPTFDHSSICGCGRSSGTGGGLRGSGPRRGRSSRSGSESVSRWRPREPAARRPRPRGGRSAMPPPADDGRRRRRPVESAVPGKSPCSGRPDRQDPYRPGRFPQDLENTGAVPPRVAGSSREEDAFPTLPTRPPGRERSSWTSSDANAPRTYNAGDEIERSSHSHRPTHGIPDSPKPTCV